MANDDLKRSYDLEKKQVEDLVGFRKELEKRADAEINDAKSESYKTTADAYSRSYLQAMTAVEEKAAGIRADAAKRAAEKTVEINQKSKEKQDKLQAKADATTDAKKKAKLEEQIKKEKEARDAAITALDEQFKKESENAEKLAELQKKQDERREKASSYGALGKAYSSAADALEKGTVLSDLTSALGGFAKLLNSTITEISSYKSSIDTRLQGSKNATNYAGSY